MAREKEGRRDSRRDRSREWSRERRRRSRSRSRSRDRDRSGRDRDRERRRREPTPERRVSRRELSPAPREPPQQALPPPPELPPPVHSIHKGTVHTIRPFGLFISIPSCRRHVLVHHSQISDEIRFAKDDVDEDKVKAMEFFLPKGQEVWVKLTEVSTDEAKGGFRINGTLRTVNQETGQDLDPLNKKVLAAGGGPQSDEPPEEGTVHTGVVKRIEPYGVFVQLQGYRKYGLVHSSQVSSYISFTKEDSDESKKAELEGVVSIGDVVHVKVVEVIPDDGSGKGPKIQCSMKLVDQATGEDLDPMGVRYKPRGAEGGGGPGGPVAPLGANAGTVKSGGKIDWGHLAGNDKLVASAQAGKYQMLDDEGEAGTSGRAPPPPGALPPPPPQFHSVEEALAILEQGTAMKKASEKAAKGEKKKKHKDKDKKKKKEGKEKSKKKGKMEKSKKDKKKRQASSSSDSSSSDSD